MQSNEESVKETERGMYRQVCREKVAESAEGTVCLLAESMGSRPYSLVLMTRCPNLYF